MKISNHQPERQIALPHPTMYDKAVFVLKRLQENKTWAGARLALELLDLQHRPIADDAKELHLLPDSLLTDDIIACSDVHPPCKTMDKYKVVHVMMHWLTDPPSGVVFEVRDEQPLSTIYEKIG